MVKKEKKEKEEPIAEFDVGLAGLFKGFGDFIDLALKLAEQGKTEIERTGEITFDKAKKLRGMYGFSVGIGRGGKTVINRFGTIKPEVKPEMGEIREPLVDVFDEKDEIIVIAELPGVEEKDIKTEVKGDVLMISAEAEERKYSKKVELPSKVVGKIKSTYKNGVLELRLDKK